MKIKVNGIDLAIQYPDVISKLVLCSGSSRKVQIKSKKFFDKLIWYPGKILIYQTRELDKSSFFVE